MDSNALIKDFDLRHLPDDFDADPYRYYRALRELDPVRRMPDGSILLTRYDDCEFVYKNPSLFSSDKQAEFKPKYGDSPLYEHHTTSLVFNDPPAHTRVRRLIASALLPKAIVYLQPGLVSLVDGLLDNLERNETVDLIEDFASAIPIEVIGNLLDVPKADRSPLRDWSLAILGALEPTLSPEVERRGNDAVSDFSAYLETLIADRRAKPGNPEIDVLTRLIQGDDSGEMLSPAELIHNCIFLLNAGHETTTNLIGNGLVLLARHPEQRQALINKPALIKSTIEEVLRFESSNQLGNRMTIAPAAINGVELTPGTPVTLCMGAANRDPERFEQPEQFDIARKPKHHLAFAAGIHQCVGMALARLEGQIALSAFVARFPDYELIGTPVRGGRARFRGYLNVPCRVA